MSRKDKVQWMNFQDFFTLVSYFKPYFSDLRGKLLSHKIAQTFLVLLMYFSLKNFRKIPGRSVPYVISATYGRFLSMNENAFVVTHSSDFPD